MRRHARPGTGDRELAPSLDRLLEQPIPCEANGHTSCCSWRLPMSTHTHVHTHTLTSGSCWAHAIAAACWPGGPEGANFHGQRMPNTRRIQDTHLSLGVFVACAARVQKSPVRRGISAGHKNLKCCVIIKNTS